MFFDKKHWKYSEFYSLEYGLYPCITEIVEAMNTLFKERHNHREYRITVEMSQRTQKLKFTLQMEDLVMQFLVRIWDRILEVKLAMN